LLAFVALIVTSPYRVNRIAAFLDPYKDPQGIGYHIIQSMEAISGGGLAGRGLGNSELKFGYLPEATTDFIYSIICEEMGLLGAVAVLLLDAQQAGEFARRGQGRAGRQPTVQNGLHHRQPQPPLQRQGGMLW
jgi:hypothetical protein